MVNPDWLPLRIVPVLETELADAFKPGPKTPLVTQEGGGMYIHSLACREPEDGKVPVYLPMSRALKLSLN